MKMRSVRFVPILLLFAGFATAPAWAEKIYETTDASGNPSFSDTAPQNARQIQLPNTQTYNGTRNTKEYREAMPVTKKPVHTGPPFRVIRITYPKNQTSIRSNPGILTIRFDLSPGQEPGYRLELIMDGKPIQTIDGGDTIVLDNVDRGTHVVQIQAVEADTGKVVQSSAPITFTLHRHSILQRKPTI